MLIRVCVDKKKIHLSKLLQDFETALLKNVSKQANACVSNECCMWSYKQESNVCVCCIMAAVLHSALAFLLSRVAGIWRFTLKGHWQKWQKHISKYFKLIASTSLSRSFRINLNELDIILFQLDLYIAPNECTCTCLYIALKMDAQDQFWSPDAVNT